MLKDLTVISLAGVGGALLWAVIISPWLDNRRRRGGFVTPNGKIIESADKPEAVECEFE